MPDYRRLYQHGGTWFFTVVTFHRRPLLQEDYCVSLLSNCLEHVKQRHPFVIDAQVILPDHLHCIWTLPAGDTDFSTRWNLVKGEFSRRYGQEFEAVPSSRKRRREQTVWQRRFWEHLVRDQEDFNRLCDYIHYNPVKHGLAKSPVEWPHSTCSDFVVKGLYPRDWGLTVSDKIREMMLE